MNSKTFVKIILNLFLVGFACYIIFLHINSQNVLNELCKEDGLLESLQAISYLLASLVFLYVCKKKGFKNVWYWGLAILFFLLAGEEISWGQRIFNLSTPELLTNINVQKELNIHNTKGLNDYVRALGLLIFMGICYIIPLTNKFISGLKDFYKKIMMPIYPLWLIGLPTISILFMAIPRLVFHKENFNLDEVGELYLALGFLLFAISEYNINRK